jgi:hypothetical protein
MIVHLDNSEDRHREVYYRYDTVIYSAGVDEYGDPLLGQGRIEIRCLEFLVRKHTPKGVWLAHAGWNSQDRFVLGTAHKQWALPTKKAALESFIKRKTREQRLLTSKIQVSMIAEKQAREALARIKIGISDD